MSWKFGYARVSREGQTPEQQITALMKEGVERENIFVEQASGADRKRPELAKVLAKARKGDAIVIWKLDRLARSTRHLHEIADDLKERGIELVSITDRIDTTTSAGKFLFTMLGAVAELERDIIRERTNAGLERARKEGRVGGRQKTDQAKLDVAFANIGRGMSRSKAAKAAGISRSTLQRALSVSQTSEMGERHNGAIDTAKASDKRHRDGAGGHLRIVAA